jgi:hypothetical protein
LKGENAIETWREAAFWLFKAEQQQQQAAESFFIA